MTIWTRPADHSTARQFTQYVPRSRRCLECIICSQWKTSRGCVFFEPLRWVVWFNNLGLWKMTPCWLHWWILLLLIVLVSPCLVPWGDIHMWTIVECCTSLIHGGKNGKGKRSYCPIFLIRVFRCLLILTGLNILLWKPDTYVKQRIAQLRLSLPGEGCKRASCNRAVREVITAQR